MTFAVNQKVYFVKKTALACPDCHALGKVELVSGKKMTCFTCQGKGYIDEVVPASDRITTIFNGTDQLFYVVGPVICPENEVFQTLEECQAYCDMESK